MKAKNFTMAGSMHPVFFLITIYTIALVLSMFICSTIFYSCNTEHGKLLDNAPVQKSIVINK